MNSELCDGKVQLRHYRDVLDGTGEYTVLSILVTDKTSHAKQIYLLAPRAFVMRVAQFIILRRECTVQ
jgi:hypothetical protein